MSRGLGISTPAQSAAAQSRAAKHNSLQGGDILRSMDLLRCSRCGKTDFTACRPSEAARNCRCDQ